MARLGNRLVRRRLVLAGLLVLCSALLLSGCESQPQSALGPHSDVAWIQQKLFLLTVWLGAAVAVIVEGALIFVLVRYRAKPGQGRPKQVHGNTRLEITWTIIPFIILTIIAIPTVLAIFSTAATASPDSLHIRATGHQWWWEFRYTDPDMQFTTANEVHVVLNRTVSFQLTTADVMHSFWVPMMGGKRDMIPNHVNNVWFTPDHLGVYIGQCAEFCGIAHAHMGVRLFVDTPAQFAVWVARQKAAAPPPATAQEKRGEQVFTTFGCIACHTLMGTIGQGTIGPNLSHVGSRTSIGADLLANTPANLALWIHDPGALKPGALMPPQPVQGADMKALVAFLESRK
jgi:cytochrome c oxidase subunit 2